jgi:hypothetical protein
MAETHLFELLFLALGAGLLGHAAARAAKAAREAQDAARVRVRAGQPRRRR